MNFLFIFNSVMLGIGLAMDAFTVSIANAMNESGMRFRRMCLFAGVYGFFQFIMPVIGWTGIHFVISKFIFINRFVFVIAFMLLMWLGIKMIVETLKENSEGLKTNNEAVVKISIGLLIVQGIATSIDALSVGIAIADYSFFQAVICSLIICIETFFICLSGLFIGKKISGLLCRKAGILGGLILCGIGIEVLVSHFIAIR